MRIRRTDKPSQTALFRELSPGACFKYIGGAVTYIKAVPYLGGEELRVALHSGISYPGNDGSEVLPLDAEVVIAD